MLMVWLLPLALLIGALATQDAWYHYRHHPRERGSIALILFVGWFPLLMWIVNILWPQN